MAEKRIMADENEALTPVPFNRRCAVGLGLSAALLGGTLTGYMWSREMAAANGARMGNALVLHLGVLCGFVSYLTKKGAGRVTERVLDLVLYFSWTAALVANVSYYIFRAQLATTLPIGVALLQAAGWACLARPIFHALVLLGSLGVMLVACAMGNRHALERARFSEKDLLRSYRESALRERDKVERLLAVPPNHLDAERSVEPFSSVLLYDGVRAMRKGFVKDFPHLSGALPSFNYEPRVLPNGALDQNELRDLKTDLDSFVRLLDRSAS
jgi:hypothetical protein